MATGLERIAEDENIKNLMHRLKSQAYKPQPVRRVYIPKEGSDKGRPLGIPAYEDKLVQSLIADILNQVYEPIFLDCSYGFRPKRNCHDAIQALGDIIEHHKTNFIVDADIKGFFDNVDHEWMMKFLEYRIQDQNLLRLIKRFLIAGIMEQGKYLESEAGTFYQALKERLKKFGLELAQDKTRIIEFGRFAKENRQRKGLGKPETFTFLGFTHYCSKSKSGKFRVKRKTSSKKFRMKAAKIKTWLRENMHMPVKELIKRLNIRLLGHYRYYGITDNIESLSKFFYIARRQLFKTLNRRSQKNGLNWGRFELLLNVFPLVRPKIYVSVYN